MRPEVFGQDYCPSQVSNIEISILSIVVHNFRFLFRTEGHQRLKRFLHPNCDVCNQEFPARMEWVEHRFSPEHLRKLKEVNESKIGGKRKRFFYFIYMYILLELLSFYELVLILVLHDFD